MKYTSDDLLDGACTPEEYYGQFDTARTLKVGGVYISCKGSWMETKYTIVYIGHGVALGIETTDSIVGKSKYSSSPFRSLFYSEGVKAGWRVDDNRSLFRLQNI